MVDCRNILPSFFPALPFCHFLYKKKGVVKEEEKTVLGKGRDNVYFGYEVILVSVVFFLGNPAFREWLFFLLFLLCRQSPASAGSVLNVARRLLYLKDIDGGRPQLCFFFFFF